MKSIWAVGVLILGGMALGPDAQAASQRCAVCRQTLGNRYWTFEGDAQVYCDRCFRTNPKCYGCGKPLGPGRVEVQGQSLCRQCVSTRPTCADCRSPILKKYYQVTGSEDYFCDRCYLYHPHCRFCGRPHAQDGPGGMAAGPVCSGCRAEAVADPRKMEKWIRDVRAWMESDLGLRVESPLRFLVQDEIETATEKPRFKTFQELGAFTVEGDRPSVVLARGLPKSRLIETVAHELAHAWQWENDAGDQRLLHKEGFAQWVAGKALRRFGHGESVVVLRERPDLYGKGFRLYEKIEREKGIRAVIEYAKSAQ